MAIARWGLKVKVIGQGQRSMQKECATRVSTSGSREYRLMVVLVGFHCDVISCELALLGVDGLWRGVKNIFAMSLYQHCLCSRLVDFVHGSSDGGGAGVAADIGVEFH